MQFNRLSAFTLGVIITAASVGAVSFANAAGDATLKACANKTSGTMRYISKGSCKKSEKSLSWSQMGPQGLPGDAGAKGDTGAAGANGTNGTNGTNGQNLYLVNAQGQTMGQVTSADTGNASALIDGYMWSVSTQIPYVSSHGYIGSYFKDSACTIPFASGYAADGINANPQVVSIDYGSKQTYDSSLKIYKYIGKGFTFSSLANVYWKSPSCTALSSTRKTSLDVDLQTLWELSEVTVRPDFSWPMTIVAR